jgi:hypothetical protein
MKPKDTLLPYIRLPSTSYTDSIIDFQSCNLGFQIDFTSNMSAFLKNMDPFPNPDMLARPFAPV